MKIAVPTLSEDGWVKSTEERADYLFSHFFVAEYSQTFLYTSQVASFPYIIQKNQGRPDEAAEELKNTLTIYFSRYFNSVESEVSYEEVPPKSGKVRINLYLSFKDETGKEFKLARAADILNSKLVKVLDIVNG